MTVTALGVDAALLSEFGEADGFAGVVHSVFGSVVNIAPPGDQLWSLAAHWVPPAPRTVRLDRGSLDGLGLKQGTQVTIQESRLFAGRAVIDLSQAARWQPATIAGPIVPERLPALGAALAGLGLTGGAYASADPFSAAVAARIADCLDLIADAVAHHDAVALRAAASGMIGLGTGLTPAGDDVLTGLAFAAAQLDGPLAMIPEAVVAVAVPGTTHAVSLTALRQACAGRAAQPLIDVLAAVCGQGDEQRITETVAALVALGHTSGTDLGHGLFTAARLHQSLQTTTK
jgi:hypothetical protein